MGVGDTASAAEVHNHKPWCRARELEPLGQFCAEKCNCDEAATPSARPADTPTFDVEQRLRTEWWLGHGCPFGALYGDDGEMQCNALTCMKDFKRDPLDDLRKHVEDRRLILAHAAMAAPLPPAVAPAPSGGWQPIETHDGSAEPVLVAFVETARRKRPRKSFVAEAEYRDGLWWWPNDYDSCVDPAPTHWQPLPLPPASTARD